MDNLNNITSVPVERITTTWGELDYVYGSANSPGAPKSKISLWPGESGTGKSRLIAQMMMRLSEMGLKSVLFQGEVKPAAFKEEKFKGFESDLIYLSEAEDLDDICQGILDVAPAWAFIDSIQMMNCVRAAAKSVGMKPEKYVIHRMREVIDVTGTHLVLISQMNADGSAKGGTSYPHLVDIVCNLRKWAPDFVKGRIFSFEIPSKNRYGPTGRKAMFGHYDWGVLCESNHRFDDSDWMAAHPTGESVHHEMNFPGAHLLTKSKSESSASTEVSSKPAPVKVKDTRPWFDRLLDIKR